MLGGIAFGATVSLGALLAADISGQDSLSGLATAAVTLGASLCAIPLARLASARGRRFALTLGNLLALIGIAVVITAAAVRVFPLLLLGDGAGTAAELTGAVGWAFAWWGTVLYWYAGLLYLGQTVSLVRAARAEGDGPGAGADAYGGNG